MLVLGNKTVKNTNLNLQSTSFPQCSFTSNTENSTLAAYKTEELFSQIPVLIFNAYTNTCTIHRETERENVSKTILCFKPFFLCFLSKKVTTYLS